MQLPSMNSSKHSFTANLKTSPFLFLSDVSSPLVQRQLPPLKEHSPLLCVEEAIEEEALVSGVPLGCLNI